MAVIKLLAGMEPADLLQQDGMLKPFKFDAAIGTLTIEGIDQKDLDSAYEKYKPAYLNQAATSWAASTEILQDSAISKILAMLYKWPQYSQLHQITADAVKLCSITRENIAKAKTVAEMMTEVDKLADSLNEYVKNLK